MILTCNSCNTRYSLEDKLLKPEGVQVKCSTCENVFTVYPPELSTQDADQPLADPVVVGDPAGGAAESSSEPPTEKLGLTDDELNAFKFDLDKTDTPESGINLGHEATEAMLPDDMVEPLAFDLDIDLKEEKISEIALEDAEELHLSDIEQAPEKSLSKEVDTEDIFPGGGEDIDIESEVGSLDTEDAVGDVSDFELIDNTKFDLLDIESTDSETAVDGAGFDDDEDDIDLGLELEPLTEDVVTDTSIDIGDAEKEAAVDLTFDGLEDLSDAAYRSTESEVDERVAIHTELSPEVIEEKEPVIAGHEDDWNMVELDASEIESVAAAEAPEKVKSVRTRRAESGSRDDEAEQLDLTDLEEMLEEEPPPKFGDRSGTDNMELGEEIDITAIEDLLDDQTILEDGGASEEPPEELELDFESLKIETPIRSSVKEVNLAATEELNLEDLKLDLELELGKSLELDGVEPIEAIEDTEELDLANLEELLQGKPKPTKKEENNAGMDTLEIEETAEIDLSEIEKALDLEAGPDTEMEMGAGEIGGGTETDLKRALGITTEKDAETLNATEDLSLDDIDFDLIGDVEDQAEEHSAVEDLVTGGEPGLDEIEIDLAPEVDTIKDDSPEAEALLTAGTPEMEEMEIEMESGELELDDLELELDSEGDMGVEAEMDEGLASTDGLDLDGLELEIDSEGDMDAEAEMDEGLTATIDLELDDLESELDSEGDINAEEEMDEGLASTGELELELDSEGDMDAEAEIDEGLASTGELELDELELELEPADDTDAETDMDEGLVSTGELELDGLELELEPDDTGGSMEESLETTGELESDDFELDLDMADETGTEDSELDLDLDLEPDDTGEILANDDFDLGGIDDILKIEEEPGGAGSAEKGSQDRELDLDLELEGDGNIEVKPENIYEDAGSGVDLDNDEATWGEEDMELDIDEPGGDETEFMDEDLDLDLDIEEDSEPREELFDTSESEEFELDLEFGDEDGKAEKVGFEIPETEVEAAAKATANLAETVDMNTESRKYMGETDEASIDHREPEEDVPIAPSLRPGLKRKKKSSLKPLIIFFLIIILAIGTVVGLEKYMGIKTPYVSDTVAKIPYVSILLGEGPDTHLIKIDQIEKAIIGDYIDNTKEGTLFVIKGSVRNSYKRPRKHIHITGKIYRKGNRVAGTAKVYCGNIISDTDLANLSMAEINKILIRENGNRGSNANVKPGRAIPFMLVFAKLPSDLERFTTEVSGSSPVD